MAAVCLCLYDRSERAEILRANMFRWNRRSDSGSSYGNVSSQSQRTLRSNIGAGTEFGSVPSVGVLVEVKRVALRRGVWFRALNRVERGVLDLTVKVVDKIRSAKLAKVVAAILDKLERAMESAVDRMVRIMGRSQAQKVSELALGWGNRSACSWARDAGFARYLVVMHMNASGLFRV